MGEMDTDATGGQNTLTELEPRRDWVAAARDRASAEMEISPAALATRVPLFTNFAATVSLLIHVSPSSGMGSPFLSRRVATKSMVSPTATVAALGCTSRMGPSGVTTMSAVSAPSPAVATTIAVPVAMPVTLPSLTVAMDGSEDFQETGSNFRRPAGSVTLAVICFDVDTRIESVSTDRTTTVFDSAGGLVDPGESLGLQAAIPKDVTAAAAMCRIVVRIKCFSAMTVRRPDWHGAVSCAVAS